MAKKSNEEINGILQGIFAGADLSGAQIIAYNDGKVVYNEYAEKRDEVLPIEDIFNKDAGGIGDRSQFWLLLIAASARGITFDSIPDFVNKTFSIWGNIPFKKEECLASTQDTLKSLPWAAVNNQESMIEFINNKCKQTAKKKANRLIADKLFVALKENPWGKI